MEALATEAVSDQCVAAEMVGRPDELVDAFCWLPPTSVPRPLVISSVRNLAIARVLLDSLASVRALS